MRYSPTVPGGQDQVLPSRVFTDQQVGIGGICAPAHAAVEQLLVCESGKESCYGFSNRLFRGIGISVCGMLGVGSWNRDHLWRTSSVRLKLFEARKAGEFVADFDHSMSGETNIRNNPAIGCEGCRMTDSLGSKKNP
jgi:hypothetical protein